MGQLLLPPGEGPSSSKKALRVKIKEFVTIMKKNLV